MNTTLGLSIASDHVSAVLVHRGIIKWSAIQPCGATARRERIAEIIAGCPRPRWSRKRVVAAIGPSNVQVKRLTGVPGALSQNALQEILHASAGRFFLKNGIPLETSSRHRSDGAIWAAAYDAVLIGEIEEACQKRGWRLSSVVPVASVLRLVTRGQSVIWQDGGLQLTLTYLNGELTQARCSRAVDDGPLPRLGLRPALATLGLSSNALVPAYAATRVSKKEPLLLSRSGQLGTVPSRKHLLIAAATCVVAFACCCLTPAVASTIRTKTTQQQLDRIARRADAGRRVVNDLDSVTRSLNAVSAFAGRTRSMTLLLAEITRALPDSCTLEQFQVNDSTGGSVVAVAPRAAVVVDALERVPLIAAPMIAGPVASISLGGRSLERVSVAFRLADQ